MRQGVRSEPTRRKESCCVERGLGRMVHCELRFMYHLVHNRPRRSIPASQRLELPVGLLEDGQRGLRHLPQSISITFDTGERLQSIEGRGEIPGQSQRVSTLSNLACFL